MAKTHMVRVSTQTKDTLDEIAMVSQIPRGEILHEAVRLFLRENPKIRNTIRHWNRIKWITTISKEDER